MKTIQKTAKSVRQSLKKVRQANVKKKAETTEYRQDMIIKQEAVHR